MAVKLCCGSPHVLFSTRETYTSVCDETQSGLRRKINTPTLQIRIHLCYLREVTNCDCFFFFLLLLFVITYFSQALFSFCDLNHLNCLISSPSFVSICVPSLIPSPSCCMLGLALSHIQLMWACTELSYSLSLLSRPASYLPALPLLDLAWEQQ